ncbi:hypothetical protein [uncultured Acinetobacter sp.]|uniref:hypothetical protein n=1 Tax=uncultured Acinetobacter sp. TaxID=165433 RepID=UPI00258976DF|nr:hypothetical protein [uncultured Acinetobacter sp.]
MVDIYQTKTTKTAKIEVVKLKSPIRLVLYGGAKSLGDNGAFFHASKNVIADYKNDLPVKSYFISKGMKQFVDLINTQPENSIQSLDTFGHGSDLGLYAVIGASLKRTLTKEEVTSNNLASNLYRNWNTKRKQWRLFGDSNWQNLFDISDINFKVFTNESKIEIHGCNTAFDGELDTLSSLISLALFKAGKKRSVVIGHADFSSPNRGGTKDITKQDYRHETRIIYNNGKVIAKTRREGRLSAEFIKKALEG